VLDNKVIEEIRVGNLRILIDEDGSQVKLGDATNKPSNLFSQILTCDEMNAVRYCGKRAIWMSQTPAAPLQWSCSKEND